MTIQIEDWKINDSEWVKARRKLWKYYEFNISQSDVGDEGLIALYKDYFLTGNNESLRAFKKYNTSDILIEMWFHPSRDIKLLKKIAAQTEFLIDLRVFYIRYTPASNREYKGESYYNGKDLEMYQALFPARYKLEYYPELNQEKFTEKAKAYFSDFIRIYIEFFERSQKVEHDYCVLTPLFWKDCIIEGYEKHEYLEIFVNYIDNLIANSDSIEEYKLSFAYEILKVLNSNDLPEDAQQEIKRIRSTRDQ